MSIKLQCDCGVELLVPADLVGKQVRCPECDAVVTVATAVEEPASMEEAAAQVVEAAAVDMLERDDAATLAAVRNPWWLCRTPEGEEFGPVGRDELDDWVREGRVSHDCELAEVAEAHTDDVAWRPAHLEYPMLIEEGNPFAPQTLAVTPQEREAHRGGTILLLALVGCFIPFISVLPAVLGTRDLRRMQRGKIEPSGESLTRTGQIIAMVATMVWMAAFAIGLLVLLTMQ